MNKEELKIKIDNIIKLTFERLNYVYQNRREGKVGRKPLKNLPNCHSRLVFPCYAGNGHATRISEQELRFAFVETFIDYCDSQNLNLYYSVETPTKSQKYVGFASKKPDIAKNGEKGRSAEFDLVIYNEDINRVCLIEFKANNAGESDHKKDFLKLNNEDEGGGDVLRYFIELLPSYSETKNGTIHSLKEKLKKMDSNKGTYKAEFRCYALEGKSQRGKADNEKTGEDISDKFKHED